MIKTRNIKYELGDKLLYIIRDHPTALVCWKNAYDEGLIGKETTLVHIDKHSDFICDENKDKNILDMADDRLNKFIEELSECHGEFVSHAMDSGLIGCGISINHEGESPSGEFDVTGVTEENDYEGRLLFNSRDRAEHDYYLFELSSIKNLSGFDELVESDVVLEKIEDLLDSHSIILDLDLDYFTGENAPDYDPRSRDEIEAQLESNFFQEMFSKSDVVTIALEPEYCGWQKDNAVGIKNAKDIFNVFSEAVLKKRGLSISDNEILKWLENEGN